MGLDVGDARIGVALSDPGQTLATPVQVVYRKAGDPAGQIAKVAVDEAVSLIVIGLPRNMDGTIGPQARKAQAFGDRLAELNPSLEIMYWDERLSTVQARKLRHDSGANKSKRATPIDAEAAALLLQSYLDSRRRLQTLGPQ